jgi:hypothetical protein
MKGGHFGTGVGDHGRGEVVRRASRAFLLGALAHAILALGCGDPSEADRAEIPRPDGRAPAAGATRPESDDWADIARRFPAAWSLVDRFVHAEAALRDRSIAAVIAIHRPEIEEPAYLEFTLRDARGEAGYVLASTGGDDFPIVAWSDRGAGGARALASRSHAIDVVRIFTVGLGVFVAELGDGRMVSDGWQLTRQEWNRRKEHARRTLVRTVETREHAIRAWQAIARRTGAGLPPDVAPLSSPPGVRGACDSELGDDRECQADDVEALVRGADLFWPPNYPQFAGTFDNGSCKVGCVPNAFAQLAAWFSHQAGDHRDGSVWGHPRVAYAFNGASDVWAPAGHDGDLVNVVTEFRTQLGTTCSGNSGMTSYFPYDRISDLSGQLFNRIGAPVNTSGIYNASWDTYARVIDNSLLQARVPVEVNAMTDPWGNSAHAWIVWGYRSDAFGEAYRVNMGWASHEAGEWVSKGSVLDALTASFTHGIDGSGVVVFTPQDLARDHGPIVTGIGQCFDAASARTDDGAAVGHYPCHEGDNQLWYLDRTRSDAAGWQIRSRSSARCLAPAGGGASNGANVVQAPCDTYDPNTLWRIEKHGQVVALRHHASGRCIDVGLATDGGALHMWECSGGSNQLFDLGR